MKTPKCLQGFVLSSCALLPAQGGVTWTQQFPVNSPSPRLGHSMVFDEARSRVLLFGGLMAGGGALADTWEWDGTNWVQRTPRNSPTPRAAGQGMAYDAARQRIVLYGSSGIGDTWEWDGTNWMQRFPLTSPGPRDNPGLAYDSARQRIVLHGGYLPTRRFGWDTWEWDGTDWILRNPRGGPGGAYPAMTYDRVRQRVVGLQGMDTWEWDGTSWTQRFPTPTPSWRGQHATTYDTFRDRTVVFGGNIAGRGIVADTMEWAGIVWTTRSPAVNTTPKVYTGMAYDSARGRVLLFGGATGLTILNDTWEYYPVSRATYAPFGTGCSGSMGIPILAAAPFNLPWIDDTFTVDVVGLATGSGVFLVAGLSNTSWRGRPLPLSLAPFGLPAACNALVSVDAVAFAFATGTTVSFGIPICNCPTLIGTTFHHQALVIDPGGPVVSNAATGVVGGR